MPKPITKKKKSEADIAAAAAEEALLKIEEASVKFKALGDPTRLRIVLFLRAAGQTPSAPPIPFDKGGEERFAVEEEEEETKDETEVKSGGDAVTVGAVAFHLTGSDKVSSNISHHIKELRHAGLITMKRRGKNILCRIEPSALEDLEEMLCGTQSDEWREALVPSAPAVSEKTPTKKKQTEVSE